MTDSRKRLNEYSQYELDIMRQYLADGAYDNFREDEWEGHEFEPEELEEMAIEASEKYQLMSYDEIYEEIIVMFTDEEIEEIINNNISY